MSVLLELENIDDILSLHTDDGLSAYAASFFLLTQFYSQDKKDDFFKTHVSNTIVSRAIEALIAQSIVSASEILDQVPKLIDGVPFEIKGKKELKCHRHYISHPHTYEWRDKRMVDFVSEQLHLKDNQAVRLYQARQSIIVQLEKLGSTKAIHPNRASLTQGIMETIILSLRLALKNDIKLPNDIEKSIFNFFKSFNEQLEEIALKQVL